MYYIVNGKEENYKKDTHYLDPQLLSNNDTFNIIETTVKKIVKHGGFPSKIVYSPYRSTEKTTLVIVDILEKIYNTKVPIHINKNIGKYLGWENIININDFHTDTLPHCPPGLYNKENRKNFLKRIKYQVKKIKNQKGLNKVWYITHKNFINELCNQFGIDYYPENLDCVFFGGIDFNIDFIK